MKTFCLTVFCMASFALSARAEAQFPVYEGLSFEEKTFWGFTVENHHAMFQLVIPPKTAKFFQGAGLRFKDRQGNLLAKADAALSKAEDGTLSIDIEVFEGLGRAELVIYTRQVSGPPFLGDLGGFTFIIPST